MFSSNVLTRNILTLCFLLEDKPRSEVKSCVKRRIEDSKNTAELRKEKRGLHALSTSDKINLATLSVQRTRMNVEVKQTKLLTYSTQDASLKAQIDSAQKLALIICPTYDENHMVWRRVHTLMEEHAQLGKKMKELSDDNNFEIDKEGRADNIRDFVDIESDLESTRSKVLTIASSPSKVPDEIDIEATQTKDSEDKSEQELDVDVHNVGGSEKV